MLDEESEEHSLPQELKSLRIWGRSPISPSLSLGRPLPSSPSLQTQVATRKANLETEDGQHSVQEPTPTACEIVPTPPVAPHPALRSNPACARPSPAQASDLPGEPPAAFLLHFLADHFSPQPGLTLSPPKENVTVTLFRVCGGGGSGGELPSPLPHPHGF